MKILLHYICVGLCDKHESFHKSAFRSTNRGIRITALSLSHAFFCFLNIIQHLFLVWNGVAVLAQLWSLCFCVVCLLVLLMPVDASQ